jgi:hypothetical protein
MLGSLLINWAHQAFEAITGLFIYIFPEYPKIGSVVVILSLIMFLVYLVRGRLQSAGRLAISTFLTLVVLLYTTHCLIKLFHVVF